MRLYAADGGPCTGKSSLLKELARRGIPIVGESARPIIRLEQWKERNDPLYTPVLPGNNLMGFQDLVADRTIMKYHRAREKGIVFSDRHPISQIAYIEEARYAVPDHIYEHIDAHPLEKVFILERLPYAIDKERVESESKAADLHARIIRAYETQRVPIVHVPRFDTGSVDDDIAARADFVLEHMFGIRKWAA